MTTQRPGPGTPVPFIVGSVILLVLGLTGFVVSLADVPGLFADDSELGALRGAFIIGSALCVGVGAVLGMLALVRVRRNRR